MKRQTFYYLFLLHIVALPVKVLAQADIHFSQFYETSILRNPALTGVFPEDYKVGVYERNQWSSISNPYKTSLLSMESRIAVSKNNSDFFSFGLLGYVDKAGSIDQSIIAFYPAVNYNKAIDPDHHTYLSVGFTAGYLQYSIDPSKATFNNQFQNGSFNPANPTGEFLPSPKLNMWDLGTGINLNTSTGSDNRITTYIIGVSGYHLTQPKFSYYQDSAMHSNIRWNLNAAVSTQLSDDLVLQLQSNFAQQGTYQELLAGGLLGWTGKMVAEEPVFVMYIGAFYRIGDAIIPVVKVKYKNLALGISYDINTSSLKEASNMQGGYEVTLFLTGRYPNKHANWGKTICPRF